MKAIVLHSGGLDSTLCLLLAREADREVVSLGVDYGQRHRIEMEFALAQCQRFGVQRRVLRVEWDKPVRPIPAGRSPEKIRAEVSPAFLPGRNVVFLNPCMRGSGGRRSGRSLDRSKCCRFFGIPRLQARVR